MHALCVHVSTISKISTYSDARAQSLCHGERWIRIRPFRQITCLRACNAQFSQTADARDSARTASIGSHWLIKCGVSVLVCNNSKLFKLTGRGSKGKTLQALWYQTWVYGSRFKRCRASGASILASPARLLRLPSCGMPLTKTMNLRYASWTMIPGHLDFIRPKAAWKLKS